MIYINVNTKVYTFSDTVRLPHSEATSVSFWVTGTLSYEKKPLQIF